MSVLRNESTALTETVISYIQVCDVSDTDEQVVRKCGDPTSNALTVSVKHILAKFCQYFYQ